jgi:transcriptional regulator NrdR family protein
MVTKSSGKQEPYSQEKLLDQLKQASEGLKKENFDLHMIADKVNKGLYNGKLSPLKVFPLLKA